VEKVLGITPTISDEGITEAGQKGLEARCFILAVETTPDSNPESSS